jgi:hypothetical protein
MSNHLQMGGRRSISTLVSELIVRKNTAYLIQQIPSLVPSGDKMHPNDIARKWPDLYDKNLITQTATQS